MKTAGNMLKFICAALIALIGIILFYRGATESIYIYTLRESLELYGENTYTKIQNATATTANNISFFADRFATITNEVYMWSGLLLMILGLYIFACALATTERKKKLPQGYDAITTITQYKALLDNGTITQEEYNEKKKEIFKI